MYACIFLTKLKYVRTFFILLSLFIYYKFEEYVYFTWYIFLIQFSYFFGKGIRQSALVGRFFSGESGKCLLKL